MHRSRIVASSRPLPQTPQLGPGRGHLGYSAQAEAPVGAADDSIYRGDIRVRTKQPLHLTAQLLVSTSGAATPCGPRLLPGSAPDGTGTGAPILVPQGRGGLAGQLAARALAVAPGGPGTLGTLPC